MSTMKRALPAVAVLLAALVPAAAAGGAATRKISVGDDYFGPPKVTVAKGTTVKFSWLEDNGNSHNVKLQKGPKGVKRFKSADAATDFTYAKKLTVPGTYKIVCTLHQDMKLTIIVKK